LIATETGSIVAAKSRCHNCASRHITVTIPNIITIIRFLLVPAIVYAMLSGEMVWALAGFLAAGISDAIDGFIARTFDQRSELGTYLDPMADKSMLVSVFVMLGYLGELPLWLVILAVSRDALIIAAVMLASIMGNPLEMKPLFVSKANTVVQIAVAAVAMTELAFDFSFGWLRMALVIVSAILTVASTAAYFVTWTRHTGEAPDGRED
jgi:cardiolipin synthase